jgi:hypothetical protein
MRRLARLVSSPFGFERLHALQSRQPLSSTFWLTVDHSGLLTKEGFVAP